MSRRIVGVLGPALVWVLAAGVLGVPEAGAKGPPPRITNVTQAPDGTSLTVFFMRPEPGPGCRGRYSASARETDAEIRVKTRGPKPAPDPDCALVEGAVQITLDQPAGSRPVIDRGYDARWEWGTGGYRRVPCGTGGLACSVEQGLPATCTPESYRAAMVPEIDDQRFEIVDARCDGAWAQFDAAFGSADCPTEGSPLDTAICAKPRVERTYWIAQGDRWRNITFGDPVDECATVRALQRLYPEELCAP